MKDDLHVFFDSNIIIYLLSEDKTKADRAEALLEAGGVVSIQVLNEITNVMLRKLNFEWIEIQNVLDVVKATCHVESINIDVHELGIKLAEKYKFSLYDAMIVASACQAGCSCVWSEDMHDGLVVEGIVTIKNPF